MFKVYMCFAHEHDYRLLGLAALVCLLASATAMSLIVKVTDENGGVRRYWLLTAAVATGFGIWSTHFISMLAFQPGLSTSYGLAGTALSLFFAVLLTTIGFKIAFSRRIMFAPAVGGSVVGLAVTVMHYIGMEAFSIAGRVVWDLTFVALSIVSGLILGAASLNVVFCRRAGTQAVGTVLLALTICVVHFVGMAAVSVAPDPSISLPYSNLPTHTVAIIIAFMCIGNLYLSIVTLFSESKRRRNKAENRRMRELADAAVEGLIVCDRGTIVTANASFEKLVDRTGPQIIGRYITELFEGSALPLVRDNIEASLETNLVNGMGHLIPVELIMRPVHYDNKPHQCIAVRDLRDRKRAEAQIHFMAHHDALTGLANRACFETRLAQEIARRRRDDDTFAVLGMDLDRFKEVNDVFGHGAGDQVLRAVAARVANVLDERDLFARLGGDEFAIIRLGPHEPADLAVLCDKIITAIQSEIDIGMDGHSAHVGSSIGVALFPTDAADSEGLLSNADAALYRAKVEGRGTFRFFEAKIGAHLRARRGLEQDFRQAFNRKELTLVYQPQAAVGTQEVFGFEALLRWVHPERGDVPPSVFISVAEETGLILPMGEWVLEEACAAAATWRNDLTLSVNISAVQLYACDLPAIINRTLMKSGLAPDRLELEIAEAALVRDPRRALQVLTSLKSLGVKISMDDFGTGFSSLSNLRNFPFDKLKIDKSFMQDVHLKRESATIVKAILGLASGLGLKVVAEGVETAEALEFLANADCAQAQGYLFAEPDELATFFDESGVLRRSFYGSQIRPLRLHVA